MKDKDYALDLDDGDYLSNRKGTINSMNLSTNLIRENRKEMYSKIFYFFSLIFSIFIAVFLNYLNWAIILFFMDIALFFLVYFANEYYKRRKILAEQHYKIIDRLKEFGININKM